jgi:hypothetical protein
LSLGDWGELFKTEKLTVRYGTKQWDGLQPQVSFSYDLRKYNKTLMK